MYCRAWFELRRSELSFCEGTRNASQLELQCGRYNLKFSYSFCVAGKDVVEDVAPSVVALPTAPLEQKMGDTSSSGFGALFRHYPIDMEDMQQHFHDVFMEDFRSQLEAESSPQYQKTTTYV